MMSLPFAFLQKMYAFSERHKGFSISAILLVIFSITLVRTFFENFSNPEPLPGFTPWYMLLGYTLFYAAVLVTLALFLGWFFKKSSHVMLGFLLLGFPIIISAPILDLLITGGKGACMAYLGASGWNLARDVFTFFGPLVHCGITPGIRIEIILVTITIGILGYILSQNFLKSLLAFVGSYLIIFFHLAMPAIIMTTTSVFSDASIFHLIKESLLGSVHTFVGATSPSWPYESFTLFASRIAWLITLVGTLFIAWQSYGKKFVLWIRDLRITRILYYSGLAILGMVLALRIETPLHSLLNLSDIFGFIVFFLVIALQFTLAVVVNDVVDIPIDRISNPDRPLITGEFSERNYRDIGIVVGFFALSGSLLFNYHIFILLLVLQILYMIYSLPPFRLKRHFVTATPVLALAGVVTIMAGYMFLAQNPAFNAFPGIITIGAFLFLCIAVQVRDFKDIEGDKTNGIITLPVFLGIKKASLIYEHIAFVIFYLLVIATIFIF